MSEFTVSGAAIERLGHLIDTLECAATLMLNKDEESPGPELDQLSGLILGCAELGRGVAAEAQPADVGAP
ncbi:MAG: hypothetical protein AAGJ50_14760 [Pseudomonadota bacterium]